MELNLTGDLILDFYSPDLYVKDEFFFFFPQFTLERTFKFG